MVNNKLKYIFDGAFGTYYRRIAGGEGGCEDANLHNPEVVAGIHREYVAAGANALMTNTFAANDILIPDPAKLRAVISRGYELAREAAGTADKNTVVFADIGVISERREDASGSYLNTAEIFIELGADKFIFETLDELEPVLPAIKLIRERVEGAEILVSFAVSQDGYTGMGKHYKDLIAEAGENSADIIGLNCVCGPSHLCSLAASVDMGGIKLAVMPNAGYPARVSGRLEYRDNPEYFAEKLASIVPLGVYAVGGCCGTTPAHIKMFADLLKGPRSVAATLKMPVPAHALQSAPPPSAKPNGGFGRKNFAEQLEKATSGEIPPLVAVELDPPPDTDVSFILPAAARLADLGVDLITVADSPLARARADSFMTAAKIKRETGVEVLPHLSCRDRNRIAVKGSLVAASIEGVQNVLVITGDSASFACHEEDTAKNVFNFNSFKLMSYINSLNSEVFGHAPYLIAGALNINAANFKTELERALRKAEAGAKLFLTQAAFTDEAVDNIKLASEKLGRAVFAGILPVVSYKNAVFLNNEVSGMAVPESFISELKDKTPDEAKEISLAFSRAKIDKIRGSCAGFYLMTPLKKIDFVCELASYIKGGHSK